MSANQVAVDCMGFYPGYARNKHKHNNNFLTIEADDKNILNMRNNYFPVCKFDSRLTSEVFWNEASKAGGFQDDIKDFGLNIKRECI